MKTIAWILGIGVVVLCGVAGVVMRAKGASAAGTSQVGLTAVVTRGDLIQKVVETGTIDAIKSVEVKSLTDGRLAKLLVDEGDIVTKGQLIALIDPRETQLKVQQDRANLDGSQNAAGRAKIEWEQRRITARRDLEEANLKLAQIKDQLRIQPTLTSSAIRSAKSDLNTAVQERDRLQHSILPTEKITSESAKREAEANYENANLHFKRQSGLEAKGFVSGKDVEDAQLAVQVAKVRLDSANDNAARIDDQTALELQKADEAVRHAQAEVDTATANSIQDINKRRDYQVALADAEKAHVGLRDVESMQKSYQQAVAQTSQLQNVLNDSLRNLGETQIKAPLDGIITKKEIQEGELVASLSSFSSGTGIVRLEDRRSLRVMLNVNEIDTAKLLEGMTADVTVDAIPGRVFTGVVKRIAPASTSIQTATANSGATGDAVVKYEVEIWLKSTDAHLRSGMSAKCTLEVLHRTKVLQIPLEFLGKEGDKAFVLVQSKVKDGKPEKKYVTAGAATGSFVELVSGVAEGTTIVKPDFDGPTRRGFMQGGPD
jgi:HlyD family secretion protein